MLIDQLRKDYEKNKSAFDSNVLQSAITAITSILGKNVNHQSAKAKVVIDTGDIIATDSSTHTKYVKSIHDYFTKEGLSVEYFLNTQGRYTLTFSGWADAPKAEKKKESKPTIETPEMTDQEAMALLSLLSMFSKQ
jgi:hypothetical protein